VNAAYHTDVLVGAIMCRFESNGEGKGASMYIASLGVLPRYRGRGIGTKLLSHALREAEKDSSIRSAYLHMQCDNEGAASFYQRHSFFKSHTVENYYARVDPPHADVWVKQFE